MKNTDSFITEIHFRGGKKHIAPPAMRAGDSRVLINGRAVLCDFRIIAEEEYQLLLTKLKELEK